MKLTAIKQAGVLIPAYDKDAELLQKVKQGEAVEISIKIQRNYDFHKKVFAFLNFCFEHWLAGVEIESLDHNKQFDVFRNHLTCLAGYYDSLYNIKGEVRIEAKSLSYGNMSQEEFEQLYSALIRAALKHIFVDADKSIENKLISFF